jgi:flagellar biosynthesis/type III secretory pathway M-ring protein FliF/YscJ
VIGGIVYSVTPTILVGLLFWFAMRAIFRADRTERKVYSEIEKEERARAEAEEGALRQAAPAVPVAPTTDA